MLDAEVDIQINMTEFICMTRRCDFAHSAQIDRFKSYSNQELTGLDLPVIIKGIH